MFDKQECIRGSGYIRLEESDAQLNQTLLDMTPPTFLRKFNNSCWIECLPADLSKLYPRDKYILNHLIFSEELTSIKEKFQQYGRSWRLRCLPKFYLIGMPKCGTTDLFTRYVFYFLYKVDLTIAYPT